MMEEYKELDLDDIEVPDGVDPEEIGPAILGKKTIVGEFRRENGIPVVRDEVARTVQRKL